MYNSLKYLIAAVFTAASLIFVFVTIASAHSVADCVHDVATLCGNDQACYKSGRRQCYLHTHPNSGPPPAPEPEFTIEQDFQGAQRSRSKKFKFRK